MSLSAFPDINVWVALAVDAHVHQLAARRWWEEYPLEGEIGFCRFTQMGLLRLLTTPAVMGGDGLSQRAAWRVYDRFGGDPRVRRWAEPPDLEAEFRARTRARQAAPKVWADAYLAAFAAAAGARLVTFDRALAGLGPALVLSA